jgi:membrane protease YdiL (CAAX protease family)
VRWPAASPARLIHSIGLCVALASSFVLTGVGLGAAGVSLEQFMSGSAASFAVLLGMAVFRSGLVVGLGLLVVGKTSLRELGWRTERLGRSLVLGLAGGVAVIAFTVGVSMLMGSTFGELMAQLTGYSAGQRLLFLCIGLEAAFSEETLFRGYLQPALVERLRFPAGLFVMASVFAVYHLNPRLVPLAAKVCLGLAFGLMRGRDRPLFISATAHGLLWAAVGVL